MATSPKGIRSTQTVNTVEALYYGHPWDQKIGLHQIESTWAGFSLSCLGFNRQCCIIHDILMY